MNIKKELNNGSGFVVFEIENMKVFKNLRKLFLKNIQLKPKDKKNINLVRKKLTLMSRVEANR